MSDGRTISAARCDKCGCYNQLTDPETGRRVDLKCDCDARRKAEADKVAVVEELPDGGQPQ